MLPVQGDVMYASNLDAMSTTHQKSQNLGVAFLHLICSGTSIYVSRNVDWCQCVVPSSNIRFMQALHASNFE